MGEPAGRAPDQHGLFASTRGLLGTGVTLLQNRLQLLGVVLAYGGAAFLCIAAGLIFLAILLTVLMWDNNRLLALGMFSALFLGAGIASAALAISLARGGSKLFSASLAELRKDRDALSASDTAKPR
jgi:uncharacterized membrane protein YqjE